MFEKGQKLMPDEKPSNSQSSKGSHLGFNIEPVNSFETCDWSLLVIHRYYWSVRGSSCIKGFKNPNPSSKSSLVYMTMIMPKIMGNTHAHLMITLHF